MQYKRGGLRNGAKELCLMMPRPCPTAGQERAKSGGKAKALADKWWTKGKVDTWQTRFGGAAKVDTRPDARRTQGKHKGGQMPDMRRTRGGQSLETRPSRTQGGYRAEARPKRTLGGHKADRRTHGGQRLEARPKRTQGGHEADKLRGRGQSISRPAFFSKKKTTVSCLGKNHLKTGAVLPFQLPLFPCF